MYALSLLFVDPSLASLTLQPVIIPPPPKHLPPALAFVLGGAGGSGGWPNSTSQILFTLCDHYQSVRRAVVTMQLEVAQRIVAKPSTKQYGILSVVFQLYARPQVRHKAMFFCFR